MCYHNLFGSRCYFFLFSTYTEHCWTGLYYNNKQIKIEHDTLASACFSLLFGMHAPCFHFFPCTCAHREGRERQSASRLHGDWKIRHHMIGAVIASETTKHIKKSPPFLACFIAPSSPFDGIITLFVLRKRTLADTIQNTAHSRGQIVPCDMDVHWHCDRELMKDLKLRCSLFLSCPSSEDMMLAGEIQAQLHIIIILIRYYSHIFTTNISLPSCFPPTCLYLSSGYGTKGKLCLLFTDVCWRLSWIFLFPPLLIFCIDL